MFKLYIACVLVTFALLCSSDQSMNTRTEVVANQTVDTTAAERTEAAEEINSVITGNHNLTMFGKKANNLIVEGNSESMGRTIKSDTESAASTNVLAVVVVAVVAALCLVGAVVGAIYVKKRRLFVWNLGGKKSDGQDGAKGVLTNASSENGSVSKCEGVMETNTEVVTEVKKEESEAEQKNEEVSNLNEQKASSSLVVNVLNELNESNKDENKPASEQADPEKQPLKNE
ncbi:hypothetical protein BpHYR1_005584 [Brachionus plicatilis]|uniref:Uncharacterized protein n=1 Tax=Brachionus plicatilis TaxID=10195 RepID=A0A3M7RHV9_BRAPC|nr:hypothetical protein BpHYR1_005584 [Brachionus plicatilis]